MEFPSSFPPFSEKRKSSFKSVFAVLLLYFYCRVLESNSSPLLTAKFFFMRGRKRRYHYMGTRKITDKWNCCNQGLELLWCPIKMRVFHQNESCLSCLHPPSSYEGRREQGRQLSFWWKTLNLIGHYGIEFIFEGISKKESCMDLGGTLTIEVD